MNQDHQSAPSGDRGEQMQQDSAYPALTTSGVPSAFTVDTPPENAPLAEGSAIKVGDTVRVRNPESYIAALANKIRDRDALVEWVGPDRLGQFKGYASVRFLKRNGRGKEFRERMQLRDLVKASGK